MEKEVMTKEERKEVVQKVINLLSDLNVSLSDAKLIAFDLHDLLFSEMEQRVKVKKY